MTDRRVPFSAIDWAAMPDPPQRSRRDALELAESLRRRALAAPEGFAQLATEYSEDVTSRDRGGALGGINAMRLAPWPRLLDVLAAIAPGEVSRVVESPHGFHLFIRHSPPAAETVSARHIVIGYEGVPWLARFQGREGSPGHTRDGARELALRVYEEAARDPSRFDSLVERFSEHGDALWGGDMGSWSTLETTPFHREIDALRGLSVGSVSPPLDTFLGFQVLLRTPNRPRENLAADVLRVPFSSAAEPPALDAPSSARQRALTLLEQVRGAPDALTTLQNEYCCAGTTVWQEGRDEDQRLTDAVRTLEVGQVAPDVIETRSAFVVARRAELPPAAPLAAPASELPSPIAPNIPELIGERVTPEDVRDAFEAAAASLESSEGDGRRTATELRAAIGSASFDGSAAARDTFVRLEQRLGALRYHEVQAMVEQSVERRILNPADATSD
ncbi:MAG TPA: peptidylprolyl isomerase [Polyangiaceae bacterium]|nr:peptidylprolyl isomerase [Polyangiaceae bacterium]